MTHSAEDIAAILGGLIGKNDETATVTNWLSTGYPELDYALSSRWTGGFAGGRIIEVSGPPSSGKTAIATWAMMSAQRAGGIAGFMDHERSFSEVLAVNLGLDLTPGKWVYKKPKTFEESITICVQVAKLIRDKKLIPAAAPICWVFDSLAQMVPQSVLYDQKSGATREASSRNMNDNTALARATSAHMPAFAMQCEEYGIVAIFLNQVRNKIGVVYGDPRTTPGGDAFKFACSQRVMLSASRVMKDKETLGNEITAQVIKNKVARPFLSAAWQFRFDERGNGKFDLYRAMLTFLDKQKCLEKSGNYIVWEGKKLYLEALSKQLEAAGAWDKLTKLLPTRYSPETSATAAMLGSEAPTEVKEEGEAA